MIGAKETLAMGRRWNGWNGGEKAPFQESVPAETPNHWAFQEFWNGGTAESGNIYPSRKNFPRARSAQALHCPTLFRPKSPFRRSKLPESPHHWAFRLERHRQSPPFQGRSKAVPIQECYNASPSPIVWRMAPAPPCVGDASGQAGSARQGRARSARGSLRWNQVYGRAIHSPPAYSEKGQHG